MKNKKRSKMKYLMQEMDSWDNCRVGRRKEIRMEVKFDRFVAFFWLLEGVHSFLFGIIDSKISLLSIGRFYWYQFSKNYNCIHLFNFHNLYCIILRKTYNRKRSWHEKRLCWSEERLFLVFLSTSTRRRVACGLLQR